MLSTVGPKALINAARPVVGTALKREVISMFRMHDRSVPELVEAFPQLRAAVTVYQASADTLLEYGSPKLKVVPDSSIIPAAIGSEGQA